MVGEVEQEDEDFIIKKRSPRQIAERALKAPVLKKEKRTDTLMIGEDAILIKVGERQVSAKFKTM